MSSQIRKYINSIVNLISLSSSLLLQVFVLNKRLSYSTKNQIKDCLIIGNGPSFKKLYEDKPNFFYNKDLVCVNHFPKTDFFEKLKPQYWVLRDSAFWKLTHQQIIEETLEAAVTKTTWPLTLLIPALAIRHVHFMNKIKTNKNIRLVFYNPIAIPYIKWLSNKLYKWNLAMPYCRNVIGAAIYTMINKGYSPIYLTGVESNFHTNLIVTPNNDFGMYDVHFYDKNKEGSFKSFKEIYTHKPDRYYVYEEFYSLYLCFKMYVIIQQYAYSQKAIIQNTTLDSFIDAFPKIKITP
jgi:hypothetical protein